MNIIRPVRRIAFLFFLLFSWAQLNAQLTGAVLDENGEPLPYATVYARNSTNGTVANASGEYKLNLAKGDHEIVFQYIGYKQKIEKIAVAGAPVRLNVRLEPSDLEISEVVITTRDPAYEIMKKAIDKRKYYKNRTPAYSHDAYIKGFYKLADAPKKLLGFEIGDMDGMLDSTGSGVLYLSESVSQLHVQASPPRNKEVMISSKVSGDPSGFSMNRATMTSFSLYDERINVMRDILSPLADNAFAYYRFRLLGRYTDENGYSVYKIEVIPKRDEDPAFHGHVYIVDDWWNLAGVDLNLTGKAIQQPIIDTMRIQQEYVPVNKPDEWCLLSQIIGFKFNVLGFKIEGFFNGVFSNYNLRPNFGAGFFDRETFRVEENAAERDTAYWSGIRPIPLTEEEARDYVVKDSVRQIRESPAYLDSMDRKHNRFRVGDIYSGYTWRNSQKHLTIGYPSLLDGLQFNTVQGWLLNFNPSYRKSADERGTRYWKASGRLNYGFSEKRLRGGLRIERLFESIHYTRAELSGGLATEQFDRENQIGEVANLLYSLWARKNYLKLYEKAFVRGAFGRDMGRGMRLQLAAEYAERRALVNHSNYSFYKGNREYSPNAPLPVTNTEPETPFFDPNQAFLFEVNYRIRFGETYSTFPGFRVSEGTRWPELLLNLREAIPFKDGMADFTLLQARLRQDDLSSGLFGYTEWSLGGGVFLRNKRVEFMDYYHPRGNQTIIGKPDRYARSFFLLPYYEFSTADAWAEAHLRHHFNGWILDKIPLIRKLNWNETLGFSAYYAEQYAWKEQRPGTTLPYWELSFGFENIGIKFIRPLHVDVAFGFLGSEHYRTGVVLGLDL